MPFDSTTALASLRPAVAPQVQRIGEWTARNLPWLYNGTESGADAGWLAVVAILATALLLLSAIAIFLLFSFQWRLRKAVARQTAELEAGNQKLLDEINGRINAETTLRDSRNLYQTLVESLPQTVFLKDRDCRYVSVNRAFLRSFQSNPDRVLGRTDHDFFPKELADKYEADDRRVMETGKTATFVEEYEQNGKRRWMNTVKTPVHSAEGEVSGILGISWDVTERKQAEDALLENQQFTLSVMNSSPDIVTIYDLVKQRDIFFSRPFSEILGYSREAMVSMADRFPQHLLHPDDMAHLVQHRMRWRDLKDGELVTSEYRLRDSRDRWRWFLQRDTVFKRTERNRVSQVIGTAHDITDRKVAEEAVRTAMDRAQRYLDIVEVIILAVDRSGRISLINRKGCQILGYELNELAGADWFDIGFPEDERSEAFEVHRKIMSGESDAVEHHESVITTRSAARRTIAWHTGLLCDDNNRIVGTLSSGIDITEKKAAEQAMVEEERRDRAVLSVSQMTEASIQKVMDAAMAAAVDLTESAIGYIYSYSEKTHLFTLYSWSKSMMPECRVAQPQTTYELHTTGLWGEAVRQRKPIITNDHAAAHQHEKGLPQGHVSLTRHLNLPVFDEGEIVAVIVVANKSQPYNDTDVRHLTMLMDGVWKVVKRLEAEAHLVALNENLERTVQLRTAELTAAHEELDRFFSVALDLLCITDTSGRFMRVNKAWESTLGYRVEELEGRESLDFVHPDDMERTLLTIKDLADNREIIDFVNRYRCSDGSYRWIEWRSTPVGNRVYAAARDITLRMQSEMELRAAIEEAQRANRAKSAFLANMSHEIRTPLNAVIGYSGLLSSLVNDDRKRSYVSAISFAGKSLLRLINDILDISKIEADRIELKPVPTNLRALFDEIEQLFRMKVSEKNVALSLVIAPEVPSSIIVDEARFRQILLNVVGNAVKFTDAGGVQVAASALAQGNGMLELVVEVRDSGIGIAPEDQERIFEPFRQATGLSTRFGGTGLGLSISRKLAQCMGGSITLTSVVDQGSTFLIRLPGIHAAPESSTPARKRQSRRVKEVQAPALEISGPLLNEFRQVLLPQAEALSGAVKMEGVRVFARTIVETAKRHSHVELEQTGSRLLNAAEAFDITTIKHILSVLKKTPGASA